MSHSILSRLYEPKVERARERFRTEGALPVVLAADVRPELLEIFFIQFCALGVQMTEPVDSWVRSAGERCVALGMPELGRSLVMHAKHEAGHHLMMIDDTRKLVARRNASGKPALDADALIRVPATKGVAAYVALHQEVIAGDAPFGQLAIEYEIERLSVTAGPLVLKQCATVLGEGALAGLSFLQEHVEIDVGHTKFNEAQIERLLAKHPELDVALARAGSAALDAYGAFFADCLELAYAQLAREPRAA